MPKLPAHHGYGKEKLPLFNLNIGVEPEDVERCSLCEAYVFSSDMDHRQTYEHNYICVVCFESRNIKQCTRCDRYSLIAHGNYNEDLGLCSDCVRAVSVACRKCRTAIIADDEKNLIRVARGCECCYDSHYYCPNCYKDALKSLTESGRIFVSIYAGG